MSNVSINVMPAGRRKVSPFCRLQVPASMKYFTTAIRGIGIIWGISGFALPRRIKYSIIKMALIAVRLHIISRKTLGGLQTDLSGRVLDSAGHAIPGLYAAGRFPDLAAAVSMATGALKEHFWAAAFSQEGRPAGRLCRELKAGNANRRIAAEGKNRIRCWGYRV